jgi:hypothetical protein
MRSMAGVVDVGMDGILLSSGNGALRARTVMIA